MVLLYCCIFTGNSVSHWAQGTWFLFIVIGHGIEVVRQCEYETGATNNSENGFNMSIRFMICLKKVNKINA
jgi:hypothetical protein